MAHDGTDDPGLANLTRNERLVYMALKSAGQPLKAYDLLDILKSKGVRAPMTIYRALEGLEQKGLVHKLDALNAYVLCNHEEPHQIQSFLVCEQCSNVEEIDAGVSSTPSVESNIKAVVAEKGFRMEAARLEIKGRCSRCA